MGKTFHALERYKKERDAFRRETEKLTDADWDALLRYDRHTGHLLKSENGAGGLDSESVDRLKQSGTIQRLVESNLIFPGGKLTPLGKQAVRSKELKTGRPYTAEGDSRHLERVPETQSGIGEILREEATESEDAPVALDSEAIFPDPSEKAEPEIRRDETIAPAASTRPSPAGELDKTEKRSEESKIHDSLVCLKRPDSFEAEQFKILRTNILYPLTGNPPQTILVTSANPEEGKSFVACNFAVSAAQNINQRVLLVDCDLRRPVIHSRFGYRDLPGLSESLTEGRDPASLLVKTPLENLTILPGGTPPPNPSELLSSERMAVFLKQIVESRPDLLVVIDSPPPSLTAETGVLARMVDGILVVARAGKTRQEDIAKLVERLGREKILGSVVNCFDFHALGYYGYRRYGKYGKYYRK